MADPFGMSWLLPILIGGGSMLGNYMSGQQSYRNAVGMTGQQHLMKSDWSGRHGYDDRKVGAIDYFGGGEWYKDDKGKWHEGLSDDAQNAMTRGVSRSIAEDQMRRQEAYSRRMGEFGSGLQSGLMDHATSLQRGTMTHGKNLHVQAAGESTTARLKAGIGMGLTPQEAAGVGGGGYGGGGGGGGGTVPTFGNVPEAQQIQQRRAEASSAISQRNQQMATAGIQMAGQMKMQQAQIASNERIAAMQFGDESPAARQAETQEQRAAFDAALAKADISLKKKQELQIAADIILKGALSQKAGSEARTDAEQRETIIVERATKTPEFVWAMAQANKTLHQVLGDIMHTFLGRSATYQQWKGRKTAQTDLRDEHGTSAIAAVLTMLVKGGLGWTWEKLFTVDEEDAEQLKQDYLKAFEAYRQHRAQKKEKRESRSKSMDKNVESAKKKAQEMIRGR